MYDISRSETGAEDDSTTDLDFYIDKVNKFNFSFYFILFFLICTYFSLFFLRIWSM